MTPTPTMLKTYARMEEILAIAKRDRGGKLTQGERDEFDRLSTEYEVEVAKGKIDDGERKLADIGSGGQRKTQPNAIDGIGGALAGKAAASLDGRVRGGRKYAEMFGSQLSAEGFQSPDEYVRIVASGRFDERLEMLAHRENSDPDGGFLVPTQYASEILDSSLENEIVRPRARVEPMTSNEKKVARWNGYDHSAGLMFGGLQAQWQIETGTLDATSGKLEQMSLTAKKLFVYTKSSNELLADASGFETGLNGAIGATIGWQMDYAFLNGTGVGEPKGVLSDAALIQVAKESGQTAATIKYENLIKMFARMYPAGRERAVWVANSTAIPQLLSLGITVGTSGNHVPVMTRGPNGFEILTRPVVFTEKVPTLGAVGDISFVDFSQYVVGLRQDMRLDRSQHVGFATDETAFRAIVRVDGQGSWRTVMTPKTGDTLSWAVTIAVRA